MVKAGLPAFFLERFHPQRPHELSDSDRRKVPVRVLLPEFPPLNGLFFSRLQRFHFQHHIFRAFQIFHGCRQVEKNIRLFVLVSGGDHQVPDRVPAVYALPPDRNTEQKAQHDKYQCKQVNQTNHFDFLLCNILHRLLGECVMKKK